MLASKGMNLAKGVKVDVPIELSKNAGGWRLVGRSWLRPRLVAGAQIPGPAQASGAACLQPRSALVLLPSHQTAADNAAAAAALSTEAINVDATTGRWEMRDEWLTAINEVGGVEIG